MLGVALPMASSVPGAAVVVILDTECSDSRCYQHLVDAGPEDSRPGTKFHLFTALVGAVQLLKDVRNHRSWDDLG